MILVVVGPTGVGKTKLSIELAKKFNGIVVNGDSMQVYKDMNIGTAKIREDEKEGVPHLLFDIASPSDMYTVYDYQNDLRKVIDDHKEENIIIVGGTGLYIKAALYDYEFDIDDSDNSYDDLSNEELYKLVKDKNPNADVHFNNRKRLIRLLNRKNHSNKGDNLLYSDVYFIGLTTDRKTLYNRINERVDEMFASGLLDEVKNLYDRGIHSKAINTGIGYKELYDYFDGKLSLEEAKDLIKQRSRHYAKRQYTWFNNKMDITWFNVNFENFNDTVNEVINYILKINK